MGERENLERAIAAFEARRHEIGDEVVDAALGPLRERLSEIFSGDVGSPPRRQQATLLLGDVCGFTTLSESLDPEEVSDLMNALWQRVDAVIVRHGGRVDKHIGDAVMALWGVERVSEEDPERAVRAALAMQKAVAAFRTERRAALTMRIGVNTGAVLLGHVGTTGEFSAIGQTVNLTERLEQAAPPDGVLISGDTYRHVEGAFDVMPHASVAVTGRTDPLPAYVVLRARPRTFRTTVRGVEGVETRMVGRDAELSALETCLRCTMVESRTRLVTISGEAGVGKSRLRDELEKWIDRQAMDVFVFKSRALPAMATVPYAVMRDLIAFRFEILETDSAATVRAKVHAALAPVLAPDEADLVGHLIGFDFSASPAVRRMLNSPSFARLATTYFLRYLRAVAERPTVAFLEDVHWADDRSLDLVAEILAAVPDRRLFVVCLARPQLFERRPDWVVRACAAGSEAKAPGDAAHVLLPLAPLSTGDSQALVDEILQRVDRVPRALRDLVVRTAEGNPYYVEELIKRLIEDGVIVRGADHWRVAVDRLSRVRVPSTLTGVLQACLDDLPAEGKTVLQRAAVVGRTFWQDAVAQLVGDEMPAPDIERALDDLCARDLIHRREPSSFSGTREYVFKHALLHDVAVDTVLLKQRRRYHVRVARWLEAHAGERAGEFLGLIAVHFERGGRAAVAAGYLRRHGEALRMIGAYRDAVAVGERALALAPEARRGIRSAVLVTVGEAQRQMGDYAEAAACFEASLLLARQAGEKGTEISALNGIGMTVRVQGDTTQAERHLEAALALALAVDDRAGLAQSLYNLGDVAFRRGDADRAARFAADSLAAYEALGDRRGMAYALRVRGFAALLRGDYPEAVRYQDQSLALFAELGDRWGVAACLINLGELARKQGDCATAVRHLRESLTIATETGARYEVGVCQNNLGHVHAAAGERPAAWAYLRDALSGTMAMGAYPVALEALVGIAVLHTQEGRLDKAAELVGLVQGHAAYTSEIGQYAEAVLADLRGAMPAPRLEASLARGRSMSLPGVAAEVLATSPPDALP